MSKPGSYRRVVIASAIFGRASVGGWAQDKKGNEKPAEDITNRVRNVKAEAGAVYKKWLENDVAYIITSEKKKTKTQPRKKRRLKHFRPTRNTKTTTKTTNNTTNQTPKPKKTKTAKSI